MAKKQKETKEETKSTTKVVKSIQPTELPDTCVVILEDSSQDFKIDHKGRQSIVLGEFSQTTPTTFALRTKEGNVVAEKQIYAMGSGSADGEIGLVHSKTVVYAVVMIANLNKIKMISVAPSSNAIDIKKALAKAIVSLGVKVTLD